jgi:hypothetical protein
MVALLIGLRRSLRRRAPAIVLSHIIMTQ